MLRHRCLGTRLPKNTVVATNLVTTAPSSPLELPNRAQRLRLVAAACLVMLVVAAGFFMSRQSDWKVLYVNLSDKDGGAVLAQLSQLNIPYKNAEGGAIMVPAEKVHETRLRLATLGLPKGSTVGFELMDSSRFGMTQFQERLTFQRGLEGELTRSIQSLGTVQSARVHLALPNQNGFFREQQKPSASVLLSLHPGRSLDRMQVAGIVHLVASSVSELDPKAVSVVDDAGNLLSSPTDAVTGASSQQMQYVKQLEQSYVQRIQDILAPVVGRQNVKAQVTLEVDFSEKEMTQQTHTPNQLESAVRSKQMVENGGVSNTLAAGVPGSATNQPTAPVTAPVNGPAQSMDAAAGAVALNAKRESVINYEVDRTIRVVRESSGMLKRVSAAVVINHQAQGEAAPGVTKPLAPEQLVQMTALVRDAVGFQRERGDSVNLMNAAFNVEKLPEVPLLAGWQQPEMHTLFRSLAWLVGSVVLAALALFIVVRPMLRGLRKAAQAVEPLLDAVAAEVPERPPVAVALPPPPPPPPPPPAIIFAPMESDEGLQGARKVAMANPAAVADIMKSWMNGEPA